MDYTITRTDPANGSFIIKPYTANGPAIPSNGTLFPGAVSADTTLILWGKGEVDYGEPFANDMVHLLENFAGPTSPFYAIQGQLWYDNSTSVLKLYNGSVWSNVAPVISFNTRVGAITLTSGDVTTALTYTPANINSPNFTGSPTAPTVVPGSDNTTNIATTAFVQSAIALVASGVTSFTDGVTAPRSGAVTLLSADVTNVLGFTPYNATNPAGYITSAGAVTSFTDGVTAPRTGAVTLLSADVTNVLGFTPFNAATATVSGGYISGIDNDAELVLTIPTGNVTITNVAGAIHNHETYEVITEANPSRYERSRLRDSTINTPGYPLVNLASAITVYDQDLSRLMGRKRRTLYTVPTGYAVVAVTTGASGTWTIAGDHTTEFSTDYALKVDGNAGAGVNITYYIISSVYSAPNTIITVTSIPGTATVSGTVRALTFPLYLDSEYTVEHNDLVVHNNGNKLYASERGNSYTLMPGITAGRWCGLYTSGSPYAFQLAVDGGIATAVSVAVAQPTYTINGVVTGVGGSWQISGNYASAFLKYQKLIVSSNTGIGTNATFTGTITGTTLTASAVTGLILVGETILGADVAPASSVVSQLSGPAGGAGTYQLSVSQSVSSQPMTAVPLYNVVTAVDSGANTIITVDKPITATATGDGTLEVALLFKQLEPIVNAALVTAVLDATFNTEGGYMQFYSNFVGATSQIDYTSGTFNTTMATNLSITTTIVDAPAVSADLGYKEVGSPLTYSSTVELDSSITVGNVIECICTV